MPKIKITEIDNTGNLQLNPITNVVFIPGSSASSMTEPVLCKSISDLDALYSKYYLYKDMSWKLAKRLLQLGMQVLYWGFLTIGGRPTSRWYEGKYFSNIIENEEQEKTITITGIEFTYDEENDKLITVEKFGGNNLEFAVEDGKCEITPVAGTGFLVDLPASKITVLFDYINNRVGYDWFKVNESAITILDSAWKALQDKNKYDIRFLTTGGYAIPSQAMVECAAIRGDCVALIDHAQGLTSVSSVRSAMEPFVSSFSAGFTPWIKTNLDDFGDDYIPASFGYLFAYARSIQNNPTWYSVAGSFRGSIPELVDVEYEYSSAEVEMLQGRASTIEVGLDEPNDNVGFAINPIAYVSRFGYLIWGNRTLVENEEDQYGVGILKATSFLNVRNLCSDVKKTLYFAAKKYTFEQNSNLLWLDFKSQVTPLLDRMVSGNGIEAYTFEQMPTDKKARLSARLTIVPIEGVEDFELEVYLEDSLEVVE